MVKWSYELNEFDIIPSPKGHKRQALANFIADWPQYEAKKETTWDLYVDGSATEKQVEGGVVLTNSEGDKLKFAIRFEGLLSNNEAEYEALLCGLKIAQDNGIRRIKIHSDSQLLVEEVMRGYEVKDDRMKSLLQGVKERLSTFLVWELVQIPRSMNSLVDVLAGMGSRMENISDPQVTLLVKSTKSFRSVTGGSGCGWTRSKTSSNIISYLLRLTRREG
ncbi:UNVERIFIED_CONTAM: hypothetical protein Sradi_5686600 [Sesamum radiatum]|uniref:RNase H type-1 domain-containing protein n=1 Tax=Sesamum radiatum TaxID=300843 RepID=A0AAW2L207_SESRA